jgi:hypothetical protein
MKTIHVFSQNQPVLNIVTDDINNKEYGVNRDRNPDSGWGEVRKTIMTSAKEVELTEELRMILIEDLAFVYGSDSKKFTEKLKEFGLLEQPKPTSFVIDFDLTNDDDFLIKELGVEPIYYDEHTNLQIKLNSFDELKELLDKINNKKNDFYSALVSFDPSTIYLDNKA